MASQKVLDMMDTIIEDISDKTNEELFNNFYKKSPHFKAQWDKLCKAEKLKDMSNSSKVEMLLNYYGDDVLFNMYTSKLDFNKRLPLLRQLYYDMGLDSYADIPSDKKFKELIIYLQDIILNEIGYKKLIISYADYFDRINYSYPVLDKMLQEVEDLIG